ncbi:MAG: M48 family metallopeptidase [Candidatus Omnitrophota bacterium]
MLVHAPVGISETELGKIIEEFKERFKKQHLKRELDKAHDLNVTAERLNKEYFYGRLTVKSIEYVTNQNTLFGSCNHKTERIRISHRIAKMPDWVRDYVVLHEMAHLVEPNHRKAFWNILSRYKLAERAMELTLLTRTKT